MTGSCRAELQAYVSGSLKVDYDCPYVQGWDVYGKGIGGIMVITNLLWSTDVNGILYCTTYTVFGRCISDEQIKWAQTDMRKYRRGY